MPKLKPATQAARREAILDAALVCFARGGVHRTTIEDICRQAAISPGALYVYFGSKESLIEGLCQRDRDQFIEKFAFLEQADDLIAALGVIGRQYLVEDPPERRLFVLEMALEATRNPRIAEIYRSMDQFVSDSFASLFTRLAAEGRIAPRMPIPQFVKLFIVIGDGIWFRGGVHPAFDSAGALDAATQVIADILAPVPASHDPARPAAALVPAHETTP
jgi:TetR/AcrR family transcriptional regulator, repressor for uid operon